ncbi:hypothetical protein HPP92_017319 [Vanilla planifolia]|uniref:Uncharacterized protein n=1 Tax=Vanilla planifolia TaxID=51239 RepID=A0A835UNW5_VANPL|nr:hypothetical protein HPP92_017866 [Vanilla planifolia]KAG0467991.1 hypothetical protein HPP92_017319 [Vanilla planifolia]
MKAHTATAPTPHQGADGSAQASVRCRTPSLLFLSMASNTPPCPLAPFCCYRQLLRQLFQSTTPPCLPP